MTDERDMKIIEILKQNSQISLSGIAQELKISKTAVKKRVDKLKKTGIIQKFTIEINESVLGCKKKALVGIEIEKDKHLDVVEGLKKIDYIDQIYSCTGEHDMYAFVDAPHGRLDGVHKQIKDIPGIKLVCFNVLQDRKR